MAVTIKSPREIELMRKAGEILAKTHEELHAALRPGMSTLDIDRLERRSSAATDAFLPLRIITDTRLPSVCPSTTRWSTGSQTVTGS